MKCHYTIWACLLILGLLFSSIGWVSPMNSQLPAQEMGNPTVIQHTPATGEEMPLDLPVEIVFDRGMDQTRVEEAFGINPDTSGHFAWPNAQTLQFVPDQPFERDVEYTVTIANSAADPDGNPLAEPFVLRFRTVGYLQITQVIPAAGSIDVEVDSSFTVMFNRPVVPLTSLGQQATLPQPLDFSPAVQGTGEWLGTSIYLFRLAAPLAGGMTYHARVKAGLVDVSGGVLDQDYTWEFTTQPPQIVWLSPTDGQDLVPPDTSVSVSFSQAISCTSVQTAFSLVRADNQIPIAGQATCSGSDFTFKPAGMLDFDTLYEVSLAAGIAGEAGGKGMEEGRLWHFRTVPLPRIIRTTPANGERHASPYTSFSIQFNAPINPDTVMPNLTFTPPIDASKVYTYFSTWDRSFTVNFGAQPSSDYQIDIGPDIQDPYGNKTGQAETVWFRTDALPPQAQLLVPGRTSTLNANDPATVFVHYVNTNRLDFRLYRLSLAEASEAYNDWWNYEPPRRNLVRRWTTPVEAPLNTQQNQQVVLAEDNGTLPNGVYLLLLSAPNVAENRWAHRHLLVNSTANLTLKTSDYQTLVWATDMDSARPLPGLALGLYDNKGRLVAKNTTSEDGLVGFDLAEVSRSGFYVASDDPFALVSRDWHEGISVWDFGYDSQYNVRGLRAHIYTDRPIYRAGQTVYFRGILRRENDVAYTLPSPQTVHIVVWDAAGEPVLETDTALDYFGSFEGQVPLATDASLGYYDLQARYENTTFSAGFQVAAYRPPEFQVEVNPQVPEIVAGQPLSATVQVSYFFGGAVADAPVEWNILAQPFRFQSKQYSRYSFADVSDPWACFDCWWRRPAPPSPILNGNGRTDSTGQLTIQIPGNIAELASVHTQASVTGAIGSQTVTIEATTSGSDGAVISGRDTVIVHQGEFYVGLAPQQVVGHAGKEMAVDIVTVDWNDSRVPNQPLNIEVYLRQWVNTFIEDEVGGGRWEWETKDELVHTDRIVTGSNAEATITFTPEQGGSYRVVVNGRDETERLVQSSVFVWVSSPESVSWRRENNDRIDLIADKTTYQVGDTAEILIPSPFEGEQWALITVERGGVLSHDVVALDNNSYVYRLPITQEHLPNIYVSAVLIKGKDATNKISNYKVGYTALEVDITPIELHLSVTPAVAQAEPGEVIDLNVRVTDAQGGPVAAELSIDVVDKAVLSLSPRPADAIVEAFYRRRGLSVETACGLNISLNRLVLEQIEQYASEPDKGFLEENALGAGMDMRGEMMFSAIAPAPMATAPGMAAAKSEGAAPPAGVALREEFADTAYWTPTVVTDRSGQARVTVKLPDNLTTWVVRGVGITGNTLVGEGQDELLVTKPLLIRPVTPRFFVVDDKAQLAAMVSNNTPEDLDVVVALSSTGLTLLDPAEQTVSIKAGTETQVTWNVEVTDVPSVDVVFSAVSDGYADAAKPRLTTGPDGTLLVHRYTAPDIVGTAGQIDSASSRTEVVTLPPGYDDSKGELDIHLDPSLAAGMRDGLKYLRHFPYECSEQIVSKFLPNVLTYRALQELGVDNPELHAELPDLVKTALDKLYTRQHEDGGWGWWAEGNSNPQISAYVIFAMTKALETGFDVKGEVFERGLQYLRSQLTDARGIESYREANRQAFILYVLTGSPGNAGKFSAQIGELFDHREKLSHYAKAYLAMTIGRAQPEDSRIDTLLSDLLNSAILSATGAHWEEADYDWWAMNTDTRSTAIILDALTMLDPENPLNPNVVRWLMIARKGGYWESTQETAWALMSLTDWMVATGELRAEYDYRVALNSVEIVTGAVDQTNVQESVALSVKIAELLKDEANRLTISRGEGPGRLYYTAHLKVYLPVAEIDPADRGISVFREYTAPGCGFGEECAEVNEAAVGDAVQVRLTLVVPHDRYYVVVEDPLPAGAEGIDVSLDTSSVLDQSPGMARQAGSGKYYDYPYWWWRWYSRTEMRDDKVVLFADHLPAGTYQYTYTFRAYVPGEYQVIPTVASEMYFPEVFGRADGRLFTIR